MDTKIKLLLLLLLVMLLSAGCEEEPIPPRRYVDIQAKLLHLTQEGYGGYIIGDWRVTNTSDYTINGWEIRVKLTTTDNQRENGIFFHHDAEMAPGAIEEFYDNVLFHKDANSIYPIELESSNAGITTSGWDILFVKGIIL